jgi:uncharacterized coiled-coil protein SlyX/predicted  nucleic acid-binding Zn-ribbon protein
MRITSKILFLVLLVLCTVGSVYATCDFSQTDIITYPNGGEYVDGTVTITWDSSVCDAGEHVVVLYKTGACTTNYNDYTIIGTDLANTGSTSWDASAINSQACVAINEYGLPLPFDKSDALFTVDNIDPSVAADVVEDPNGGELIGIGTYTITWDSSGISDTNLKTNPISLYYSIDSGSSWTLIASNEANDGSYDWSIAENAFAGGDAEMQIKIEAEDKAGHIADDTSDADFSTDTVKPTVSSVDSDGALYNDGTPSPVDTKVTFSEDVTTLSIAVSGDDQTENNCGDLDMKTWCFLYTVPAATDATKTIQISAAADTAGNTMVANSAHTFDVDTLKPTIASATASPDPAKDGLVFVTVVFSETMDTGTSPTVTITGLASSPYPVAESTYSGTTWTGTFTLLDNDETATGTIDVSGAEDAAGNTMLANAAAGSFDVDTEPPTGYSVSIDQAYINDGNKDVFSFTFAGAEVGATYTYSIDDSAIGSPVSDSGTIASATQQITGIDVSSLNDDTLTLTVYLTDDADNQGSDTTDTVTKDVAVPTVSSIDSDSMVYNDATVSPVTIKVTFSEDVSSPAISVSGGAQVVVDCTDADATTWCFDYTVPAATEATKTVRISASADAAGNTMSLNNVHTFDVDTIKPTVTTATASPDPTKAGLVTVTVVFSETMDIGTSPTVSVTGLSSSPYSVTQSTYSGTTWTGTFTLLDNNEEATATIKVSGAKDAAENTMAVNNNAGTFSVDTLQPTGYTAAIDQAYINNGNKNALSFTFAGAEVGATYTYSIDDSAIGSPVTSSGTITSATQQITGIGVSSLNDDTLTLTVYLTDTIGNQGSDTTDTVTKDVIAPTVSSVSSDGDLYYESTPSPVGIMVTFSEDVLSPTIAVSGSAQVVDNCADADAATWCFDYTVPAATDATKTIQISASADTAGNTMVANSAHTFDVDTIKPTVTTATASPDPAKDGVVTVTIVFSETMDTATSPTVTVTGLSSSPYSVIQSSYSGTTWTGTFTLLDDEEEKTATITVSGAKDAAENTMTANNNAGTFDVDTVGTRWSMYLNSPATGSTVLSPVHLSVDSDGAAGGITACQYKNVDFTYGTGTAMTQNGTGFFASITLADGSYLYYVICVDDGMNAVKRSVVFTVGTPDTTAPVIIQATLDRAEYQKTINPNVQVTIVEDNTATSVMVDGAPAAEGPAGTWTKAFAHSGAVGTYTITVTAEDASGNINTKEISYHVVEDNQDPSSLAARIDALNSSVIANANNIAAMNTSLNTQTGRINTLNTTVLDHSGQIAAVNATANANTGRITAVNASLNTQTGRIDTLNSSVQTLDGDVSVLQSNVTALRSDVTVLQTNVTSLRTDVGALQGNVTSMQTELDSLETNVTGLEGDVSILNGNVSELRGDVDVLEINVSELYADIIALEGNDSALLAKLDVINASLLTQTGRIDILNSSLLTQTGRIDTLNSSLLTQIGRIDTINASLLTQTGRIDTLNSSLSTQISRIDALENTLNAYLDFEITDNTSDIWDGGSGTISITTSSAATCSYTNELASSSGAMSTSDDLTHTVSISNAYDGLNVYSVTCVDNTYGFSKDKIVFFYTGGTILIPQTGMWTADWNDFWLSSNILNEAGVSDHSISNVLSSPAISGKYDKIWQYDWDTEEWKWYIEDNAGSQFDSFDSSLGYYWIHLTSKPARIVILADD